MCVFEAVNLPNSRTGIRHYKMLTVDEMSLPSEESVDGRSSPSLQHIDMDLMEDLRDVIYKRCSVSSDNINSFGILEDSIEDVSEVVLGFSDSFCITNEPLPAPIPPPRSRKNTKPSKPDIPASRGGSLLDHFPATQDSLIQLESIDDISLFDPLKENNTKDSDLLSFLAPMSTSDSRVTELKNTIQHITSYQTNMNSQSASYFPSSTFGAPRVAQPGLVMPRYPLAMNVSMSPNVPRGNLPTVNSNRTQSNVSLTSTNFPQSNVPGINPNRTQSNVSVMSANLQQSNGFSNFESTIPEVKPPLPPKTKPSSSTFFVASSELSEVEKDLLNDYGLSSSPLFCKSTEEASGTEKSSLKPVDLLGSKPKVSPRLKKKELKTQPTWQKFT